MPKINTFLKPVKATIFYENVAKEKKPLIILRIKEQNMYFDLDSGSINEMWIKISCTTCDKNEYSERSGFWLLSTFSDFVYQTEALIKNTSACLNEYPKFEATTTIKDSLIGLSDEDISNSKYLKTGVSAKKISLSYKQGMFSSNELIECIGVSFEIFGNKTQHVKWSENMLSPIVELKEYIIKEHNEFANKVIGSCPTCISTNTI